MWSIGIFVNKKKHLFLFVFITFAF
jgi:hypothetical protein